MQEQEKLIRTIEANLDGIQILVRELKTNIKNNDNEHLLDYLSAVDMYTSSALKLIKRRDKEKQGKPSGEA